MRIGMRTMKTVGAVTTVLLFTVGLTLMDPQIAEQWYSPFFAGIAAAYSIQNNTGATRRQASTRVIGSLIGGLLGMIVVFVFEELFIVAHLTWLSPLAHQTLFYVVVGFTLIVLIQFHVKLKLNHMIFVSILTYLSMTVSTRANLPLLIFAFNRIGSTTIGALVALLFDYGLPKRIRRTDRLFVLGVDDVIIHHGQPLTGYARYQLNHLYHLGAKLVLVTSRTPTTISRLFTGIEFHSPLILLDGAVTYDPQNHELMYPIAFDAASNEVLLDFFADHAIDPFAYAVFDGVLSLYHRTLTNPGQVQFYTNRRTDYLKNHIKGLPSVMDDVISYLVIDRKEALDKLVQELSLLPHLTAQWTLTPYIEMNDYWQLKLHHPDATKAAALQRVINDSGCKEVIAFVAKDSQLSILEKATQSYAPSSASEVVKQRVNQILPGDNDMVLKVITQLFHRR